MQLSTQTCPCTLSQGTPKSPPQCNPRPSLLNSHQQLALYNRTLNANCRLSTPMLSLITPQLAPNCLKNFTAQETESNYRWSQSHAVLQIPSHALQTFLKYLYQELFEATSERKLPSTTDRKLSTYTWQSCDSMKDIEIGNCWINL